MIAITEGTQRLVGTYGYVVALDLSAYEPQVIHQVQLLSALSVLSDIFDAAGDPSAVDAYCEDADCPDVAFYQTGNTVNVFLKTSVYAFVAGVTIEFTYHRNAQNITDVATEYIDIPQSAKELFKNLCIRTLKEIQGADVPFDITNNIRREQGKLGL